MDASSNDYWLAKDMALSPDNRYIALANLEDDTVRIYNAQTLGVIRVFPVSERSYSRMLSLAWSPDSRYLAIATTVGLHDPDAMDNIAIWDVSSHEMVLQIPNVELFKITWSPDGQRLVGIQDGGRGSMWNAHTGEFLSEHYLGISSNIATWIDNTHVLFVNDAASYFHIWDTENNLLIEQHTYLFEAVHVVAWNPEHKILAVHSHSMGFHWFEDFPDSPIPEFPDYANLPRIEGFAAPYFFDLVWSLDNSTLAAGVWNGLLLLDWETQEVQSFTGDVYPEFAKLAWFSDNNTLAAVTRQGILFTWDIANECLIAVV